MNRILEVYDRGIFNLSDNFLQVTFPFEEDYENDSDQVAMQVTMQDTMHVTMHVTMQVTMQVAKMIKVMDGMMSRLEIMQKMNLFNRDYFRLECLQPSLKECIIEMTIPDKPKSRFQKYRLTDKGIELKKNLISDKNYKIISEKPNEKSVSAPDSDYSTMHVTMHVESLIHATEELFTVQGMMEKLKLKNRPFFKLEYIKPALQFRVIEPIKADDSNNKIQKYRLTEKGMKIKKLLNDE
jgi:predicted transcriptional regulator